MVGHFLSRYKSFESRIVGPFGEHKQYVVVFVPDDKDKWSVLTVLQEQLKKADYAAHIEEALSFDKKVGALASLPCVPLGRLVATWFLVSVLQKPEAEPERKPARSAVVSLKDLVDDLDLANNAVLKVLHSGSADWCCL